jgi:uroporphyrinogen-III synthase
MAPNWGVSLPRTCSVVAPRRFWNPCVAANDLTGWRILVTRPEGQAGPLSERIEQLGGRAYLLPLIAIAPSDDVARAQALFSQLSRYQWLIFISANAVVWGWPYLEAAGGVVDGLPRVAVVGKATASAVLAQGGAVAAMPEQDFSSAGLLALPEFQQVQGQRCLIVRGEGGKETLANVLRQRGAHVDYAEVYRREFPPLDLTRLRDARGQPAIDVIALSSVEAMQHLAEQARQQHVDGIFALPLVVVHPRHVARAQALGFTQIPFVADNATDEAVVAALLRAHAQSHNSSTSDVKE